MKRLRRRFGQQFPPTSWIPAFRGFLCRLSAWYLYTVVLAGPGGLGKVAERE